MAANFDNCDLGTSNGVLAILKGKLQRNGAIPSTIDKFSSVLELENVPDIRALIESGLLSFSKILEIRNNSNCIKFRRWLHETESHDARELEQAYVQNIGLGTSSIATSSIRFLVTTAAGIISPIAGLVAGATDSFLLTSG